MWCKHHARWISGRIPVRALARGRRRVVSSLRQPGEARNEYRPVAEGLHLLFAQGRGRPGRRAGDRTGSRRFHTVPRPPGHRRRRRLGSAPGRADPVGRQRRLRRFARRHCVAALCVGSRTRLDPVQARRAGRCRTRAGRGGARGAQPAQLYFLHARPVVFQGADDPGHGAARRCRVGARTYAAGRTGGALDRTRPA